jgi:RimJ/RimL family protein N-acetyltransferase
MEPVTLTTERLVLRAVGPADADAVHAAAQDAAVQRWIGEVPSPYLPEHAQEFTARIVPEGWATDTSYSFGMFLPDGRFAGMISLTPRSPGIAEVGFWTAKEHRGNGYTSEATLALARWAFLSLRVDRLQWRAEVGNGPSRAVAERVGFTLEGVLRAGMTCRGTTRDCWIGSLLPSDLGLPSTLPYLPGQPERPEESAVA